MTRRPRFLLCDTVGRVDGLAAFDQEWVSSPIKCLNRAVALHPDLIGIGFGDIAIQERAALVELAGALKQNQHTRKSAVLALLRTKQRRLMEDLARADVDYVRQIGNAVIDAGSIRDIIERLGPDDRLSRHLVMLCPFLHYTRIDCRHEMTVCGAYMDRMVLGGRRLHEICETADHCSCEYGLNPRITS